MNEPYMKETSMSLEDIVMLRESFVTQYCATKGWDKDKLTTEQIMEIRSMKEWQTPGLIKG